ncbi:UPF0415 protein C7orf25 homolog [Patella vulgata]|uniref:UPF0415 protein C7orf25 homolog n=1 Tax=Patella vulgata TaxID=6465 RepID=UPI00218086DF|nr:UPF0415 protein C7orf25 homolog [Patella vulgata]
MATSDPQLNVDHFILFAEELLGRCKNLKNVEGSPKLERKINSEIKFLKTLKKNGKQNSNSHLKSSNLSHYAGVVHAAEFLPGVIQVLQSFSSPGKQDSLTVDVVAGEGHMWVKVIARKAQALHLVWAGKGQFGERDLIQQVDEYMDCVQVHPFNFLTPEIHFAFYNNVTCPMAEALETRNIKVWGHRVMVEEDVERKLQSVLVVDSSDESDFSDSDHEEKILKQNPCFISNKSSGQINNTDNKAEEKPYCEKLTSIDDLNSLISNLNVRNLHNSSLKFSPNFVQVMKELLGVLPDFNLCDFSYEKMAEHLDSIKKVNLDITSLIALVSGVTHGGSKFVFKEKILSQQAAEERDTPCLEIIRQFLEGKELIACKSAVEDFNTILDTLGGEGEKERSKKLLEDITIVEDQPSDRALQLEMFGKVKGRSRIIFGTGDTMKAITVTANSGFVRAARNQGIAFAVYIHPARALTEQKEKTAILMETTYELS